MSNRELSIIIPSRQEEFLKNTVDDILENIEANTEIIIVLDGAWASTPIPQHERITIVYLPESIGQRASCNLACKLATGKYVAKVDAHCSFDKGFDRKMLEAFKETGDNVVMVPNMKNLHIFNWLCKQCGESRYQGKSGVCTKCGGETEKEIVFFAKPSPNSVSYCFDSEPHFQYFKEFCKRPEGKGDITPTMSLQGSFFMMTREKYMEFDVCNEEFGSWGSQGIEISMKMRLSGNEVLCNKKTWYAHCFRTAGGDFSFPYPQSGRQVQRAKQHARDLFFNSKWDKQIYPLSKVLKDFWPVRGWTDEEFNKQKEREMKCERPGIYTIINNINNKVYIGSTKNLAQRFNEHLRGLKGKYHDNDHLQKNWNKYGENNFSFETLRYCEKDDLAKYEQKYIDEYREKIGWRNMFNANPNAISSVERKHTKESLAKMRRQQKGEGNGFYGKKHTEESIQKMKEYHKGQTPWNKGIPCTDETKKNISDARKGCAAWNKGLNKETDERIKEYADKQIGIPRWENQEHPKGMLGKAHNEITKKKISDAQRGVPKTDEHNRKNKEAHLGKVFTQEHCDNISLAQINNPRLKDEKTGKFISSNNIRKSIIFYTDNQLNLKIAHLVQKRLRNISEEMSIPIISASLKLMNFGKNIHIKEKRGKKAYFKQILSALEASDADVVYFCEHDVVYNNSSFSFIPPKKDTFYFNINVIKMDWETKKGLKVDECQQISGMCCWRELALEFYRGKMKQIEEDKFDRHYEPQKNRASWSSEKPIIDIRHGENLTASRWEKSEFRNQKYTKGWTEIEKVIY